MLELQSGELPIGFGVGKNSAHWQRELLATLARRQSLGSTPRYHSDAEILSIENVAQILNCSVDRVRRISRKELPARSGPGRGLLYLREDLISYVKRKPSDYRRNTGLSPQGVDSSCVDNMNSHVEFDINTARTTINA